MSKTRLALAGLGTIGRRHADIVSASGTVELTAIADPSPEAAKLGNHYGVAVDANLNVLLQRGGIDGVIIATPSDQHSEHCIACLEHGIPVLVEKPFATNVIAAREMVKVGRQKGTPILTGHYRRFSPQIEVARDTLNSGAIGDLIGVSSIWAMRKHDAYYDVPWRIMPGGGPILTNLIHDIDCLRWLCGEIVSVSALVSSKFRGHPVEDTATITLEFGSGALGSIFISDAAPSPWAYEATTGENADFFHMDECCYRFMGTCGAFDFPLMRLWKSPEGMEPAWHLPMTKSHIPTGPGSPLVAQIEHFRRVIQGEEMPRCDGIEGARTLAAALAVVEASRNGNRVVPESI